MPEMAAYTLLLLPVRQKIIPGSGVLQEAPPKNERVSGVPGTMEKPTKAPQPRNLEDMEAVYAHPAFRLHPHPPLDEEDQEAMDKAWAFFDKNCPDGREFFKDLIAHCKGKLDEVFIRTAVGFPLALLYEGGIAAVKQWVKQIEAFERAKRGYRPDRLY